MKKIIKLFIVIFFIPNFAISQIWLERKQYVYNNSKDTIRFNNFKPDFTSVGNNPWFVNCSEPRIVDSIQIDGLGRKEIVFSLSCIFSNSQHGGSFDINEITEIGKYEVWNLDTKTILFEVINYRKDIYDRFIAGQGFTKGSGFYKYNVTIDSVGIITVKKAEEEFDFAKNKKARKKKKKSISTKKPITDKEEGIYKFENGKYTKLENY